MSDFTLTYSNPELDEVGLRFTITGAYITVDAREPKRSGPTVDAGPDSWRPVDAYATSWANGLYDKGRESGPPRYVIETADDPPTILDLLAECERVAAIILHACPNCGEAADDATPCGCELADRYD